MDNRMIAQRLSRHARELASEGGHLYRVRAYRRAAQTILGLDQPLGEIVAQGGARRLRDLPGIGSHLALALEHLVRTGEFHTFEEIRVGKVLAENP